MSESYIIGIVGGSGSGKTTFVKKLKEDIEGLSITIISADDYYLPREAQFVDENGIKNFDLPSSIDSEALAQDLSLLISNQTVVRDEYTFNNAEADARKIEFRPAKIYLIEGLFLYHYESLKDRFDFRIFIQAKENIKVIRRIKRDRVERNYPLEDVLYRYENHVLPSYEKYIAPYSAEADIIINNNYNFDEAYLMVKQFILSKL